MFESKNERIARPGHQENPERKCFAKKKRKEKSPEALLMPRGKGYSLSLYKSYGVIWYT